MNSMFGGSKFNNDISLWDVRNVTDMSCMFDESMIQESFKPVKVERIYNFEVIKSDCVICWEEDIDCHVLPCFHSHVVCFGCIKEINLCPFCRIAF